MRHNCVFRVSRGGGGGGSLFFYLGTSRSLKKAVAFFRQFLV
jgi:hypothetical protein